MAITVDRNVPLPPKKKDCPVWPFKTMAVGDSFVSPKSARATTAAACYYSKKHGLKFTVRTVGEVVKCWRLA